MTLEKELDKHPEMADVGQNVSRRIIQLDNGWIEEEAALAFSQQDWHPDSDYHSLPHDMPSDGLLSLSTMPLTSFGTTRYNWYSSVPADPAETANTVAVLESLAWGRHSGSCHPHRGCNCYTHGSHSEMVSINVNPNRMFGSHSSSLAATEYLLRNVCFGTGC